MTDPTPASFRKVVLLAALITTCIAPSAAGAQTTPTSPAGTEPGAPAAQDDARNGLPDIVVTAEKREQNLRDVPISITALTQEDIRQRRIDSVADIVRQTPNVNFGEVGFGTQLSSRGIGTSLITGIGESSVAVFLDGVNIPRPAMASLLQRDLGRTEFLRGPQGTLYGRNATGGVLNLISPDVPRSLGGDVRVGFGNYGSLEAAGDIGGPIGENVRGRVFVSADRHDGYTRNLLGTGELDGLRAFGTNAAVVGEFGALKATLRGNYQWDRFSGPTFHPIQTGLPIPPTSYSLDAHEAAPNVLPDRVRHSFVGSLRLELDAGSLGALGDASLVSTTGFVSFNTNVRSIDADGTSLDLFSNRVPEVDRSFSQELNLVHTGGLADWTVGAFYIQEHNRADRIVDAPGFRAAGLTGIEFRTRNRTSSKSVFADTTIAVADRLKLFGGLRGTWDRQQQDLTSLQYFSNGATIIRCSPADSQGNLSRRDSALTGRLGARYDAGAANFYMQASRGYKSGGIGYSTCGNTFQPERLNAIEAGVKSLLADRRLRLDLAGFYYDLKNLQVEQIVTVGSIISSVPKTRIYGAELESDFLVTPRFRVNASIGLLNAEYVRFFDTDSLNPAAGLQDLSGNKLNRSPTFSATYGAQYEQPVGAGSLLLRAEARSTSRFTLRPANQPLDFQRGYTLVDASITYRSPGGDYQIRGYVKNLTDRDYLQGLFSTVIVQRVGTYGAPRTAGVELTARF